MTAQSQTAIVPTTDRKSKAIHKFVSTKIIRLHPGLGDAAVKQAELLSESGLTAAQSAALLLAIYTPSGSGAGQSNRAKWMVKALQERYADRLQRVASNLALFRQFVGEIEDIAEARDELNDGSVSFSFHETFMCDEAGLGADEICRLMNEQEYPSMVARKKRLMEAVRLVLQGKFSTVEGALFQCGQEDD